MLSTPFITEKKKKNHLFALIIHHYSLIFHTYFFFCLNSQFFIILFPIIPIISTAPMYVLVIMRYFYGMTLHNRFLLQRLSINT